MKTVLVFLGILLLSITCVAVGWTVEEPAQLTQLLKEADRRNPSLLTAFEQISVAESRIDQVSSLQDPVLSIALLNYPVDNFRADETPMTGNEVRLAQKFPFPGKLDTKGKIAAKRSRWFASAYQDARLKVRQKVKDAWYRLLFQKQAIELTNRNLSILDDFIKLTESRYEVGKGLQQNVLKAHLQRSKQLDKLLALQQQQEATLAELNSLAGRETDQDLDITSLLEPSPAIYSLSELQQQAEQNRPMYAAFKALIGQYKEQRKLSDLDSRPDFTLWAGYRFRDDDLPDDGTDFVSTGISFNLPVYRKRLNAAVAEADSSLRVAYQKRSDFDSKVKLSIHQALSKLEQMSRLAELYQTGIIPQANQTFQATLSAYQVDKVDFLSLLDSLMSLYRYKIDYVRTVSDQLRSQAQIEAAAGLDLEKLQTIPNPVEG